MAVEKIYELIKKLPLADRYKLRVMLDADEINEEDIEASKRAAGGWDDVDAEKLIKSIYLSRENNPGRVGVDW